MMLSEVLRELLPERNVIVRIATGGGTFADPDNRAMMLSDGAVAWLDLASFGRLVERIPSNGRRPLAADLIQMEQLYLRRRFAYAEAHVRIDAAETKTRGTGLWVGEEGGLRKPVDEIVERLLEWIGY